MKLKLLLLITMLSAPAILGQSNAWRGIVPLRSTRGDVEKLLGKAGEEKHYGGAVYKKDEGRIVVHYTATRCDRGWDVPKDTVISIKVPPPVSDANRSAADLKLDEAKFFVTTDDAMFATWTDPEEGLQYYFMHGSQALLGMTHIPLRSDNTLRCDGFPPYVPEAQYWTMDNHYRLHDPKRDKKDDLYTPVAYLQNFLIHLRNQRPGEFKGYVLIYFDDKLPLKEYRRRVSRIRALVSRTMKPSQNELTFIESGMDVENSMEFYVLAKDRKPPAPNPTLPSPQFMKKAK